MDEPVGSGGGATGLGGVSTGRPRTSGRPHVGTTSDTVGRIIDAAKHLMAENGYSGTTTKEIGTAAGVAPATIYHHFESKEEVWAAVVRQLSAETLERFEGQVDRSLPLREQLLAILAERRALQAADPVAATFNASIPLDVRHNPKLAEAFQATGGGDISRFIAGLVSSARARGELTDAVSDDAILSAILSLLSGLSMTALFPGANGSYGETSEVLELMIGEQLFAR